METMQLEVFPQGEWVCHKGSISTTMYIVMKGSVSIIIDESRMMVVKRLVPGTQDRAGWGLDGLDRGEHGGGVWLSVRVEIGSR